MRELAGVSSAPERKKKPELKKTKAMSSTPNENGIAKDIGAAAPSHVREGQGKYLHDSVNTTTTTSYATDPGKAVTTSNDLGGTSSNHTLATATRLGFQKNLNFGRPKEVYHKIDQTVKIQFYLWFYL